LPALDRLDRLKAAEHFVGLIQPGADECGLDCLGQRLA
jgi:hypothetical protein